MLQQSQHLFSSHIPFLISHSPYPLLLPHLSSAFNCLSRPNPFLSVSVSGHLRTRPDSWLAQVREEPGGAATTSTAAPEEGPIELPPSTPSIFATSDDPSPLQVATSVLLTGAISVFLFRSIRRQAKRAKELKFRSSGAKKTLKEEAIESLKTMAPTPVKAKGPPSPVQALLGGLSAGVIALILYKFTTTIEGALNRQTLSDNFSVRQITITIRTILNGLCYLATFVFGINSVGLFLYSGQLAINSLMGDPSKETENKDPAQLSNPTTTSPTESLETGSKIGDQNSDGNNDERNNHNQIK